jgi:GGDEF domain-containing protein
LPRLGREEVDVAFLDLVDFGAWNNALGMERGDALLAALAAELRTIPGALAIRDGGDEFLVVGRPTAHGLVEQLETFRRAWPGRLRAILGDVPGSWAAPPGTSEARRSVAWRCRDGDDSRH